MHKFTIFTVLFSLTVIVIIAELLINDFGFYSTYDDPSLKTNILEGQENDESSSEKSSQKSASETDQENEENVREESSKDSSSLDLAVTLELLGKAGFIEPSIRQVDFNGSLFQLIDLKSYSIDPVVKANLFDKNEFKISLNEIHQNSDVLAEEVYRLIKEEASLNLDIIINETNQYGDASSYLNHSQKKKTAFLLVLIGNSVYGLEYPHTSHPLAKALIHELKVLAKPELSPS